MTFRYVLDPLFMLCSALYVTNGWLLKPNLPTSELFFRNYFDDILLIPCFLPIVLLAHKCLSLRSDDAFPTAREAVIHLIIWSICFELIGPLFYSKAVGDPLDVAAYWLGGIASLWIWTTRGRVLRESGVRAVERVPLGRVTFKIIGSYTRRASRALVHIAAGPISKARWTRRDERLTRH